MYKLNWEKAEEPEIKLPTFFFLHHRLRKGVPEKHLSPLHWLHWSLWLHSSHQTMENLGVKDHLTCLLRNLYAGQEATVRTGHGTIDWSKLRKEYNKTSYSHPAYLTYMQSRISWKMMGWMNHKLETRLPGEISITSEMQMTLPLWQKVKRN